jgi:hypothetical protein
MTAEPSLSNGPDGRRCAAPAGLALVGIDAPSRSESEGGRAALSAAERQAFAASNLGNYLT